DAGPAARHRLEDGRAHRASPALVRAWPRNKGTLTEGGMRPPASSRSRGRKPGPMIGAVTARRGSRPTAERPLEGRRLREAQDECDLVQRKLRLRDKTDGQKTPGLVDLGLEARAPVGELALQRSRCDAQTVGGTLERELARACGFPDGLPNRTQGL